MTRSAQSRLLALILGAYVILAVIYSFVTPPFEASDELWHYPMVKYLADNGLKLPIQNAAVQTAWRQEGSQPPLYYMMAAVLTSWIDTSDMDNWRRVNPHTDIGVVRPDRNVNMVVHRPEESQNRFTGALLALQISRFFSVALGAATVCVTYLLGRALFPDRPIVALLAAAFNAFLPMFLFISGSVNNDNLSNLLGSLLTLLLVRLLLGIDTPGWRTYTALGIATGAGILSKLSIGFFIPLVALSLLILSLRRRDWRPFIVGGLISGGLTILIAGWWFLRNAQLYGDPTGLNVFLDIVGRRAIPANAAQLWSERDSFLGAFWGFFGGMNVPLPAPIYVAFNTLAVLGTVSVVVFVIWHTIRLRPSSSTLHPFSLPHFLTLLWIAITCVSYLRWTAETPASQGRLVFVALSSFAVWLAIGWTWWLPKRARLLGTLPVAYSAFIAAVLSPWLIAAHYAGQTTNSTPLPICHQDRIQTVFYAPDGGSLRLCQNPPDTSHPARPDTYTSADTSLEILAPFPRDWSYFVHLVTQDGVIIGQRDIYPHRGLLATSDLVAQDQIDNPVSIFIPSNAYAPQTLDVVVGWYDLQTGERMRLADGSETYTLEQIELIPRESEYNVPNPMSANFARQIELVGYALSDLSPAQGKAVTLTLYWRGLQSLTTDYVVFAQIIDPMTTTIFAASDAMPAAWARPTTTWMPGEIIEDAHTLTVNAASPPGIYEIYVGLYTRGDDGSFNRLRVVTPDGGEAFDYIQLSRVRILPEGS
jgi:hypothetical protein